MIFVENCNIIRGTQCKVSSGTVFQAREVSDTAGSSIGVHEREVTVT